jgi:hypothetical protein
MAVENEEIGVKSYKAKLYKNEYLQGGGNEILGGQMRQTGCAALAFGRLTLNL